MLVNRQFQWRMAFDADPQPSIEHTLNLAEEPVVEVSVRALDADEHDQVSLAALRNVIVNYDEMKSQAQESLAGRSLGIGGETTESFRPIDEEELNYPDGVRGVRLRYVLRPQRVLAVLRLRPDDAGRQQGRAPLRPSDPFGRGPVPPQQPTLHEDRQVVHRQTEGLIHA